MNYALWHIILHGFSKHCKKLLEISELSDIERKMGLYKSMFYCNLSSDHDPNYIQMDSLRIDLMAGGLNWKQQEYIISKLNPTEWDEVSYKYQPTE